MAGTSATVLGACADLLARTAAAWGQGRAAGLAGAATRLVEALPGDPAARIAPHEPWRRPEGRPRLVVDLLTGLGAIDRRWPSGRGPHPGRPKTYGFDAILVPAARTLIGGGRMQGATAIERLRVACVAHLRPRVAEPLAPPADWRAASALPCRCPHCAELARFLADLERQTWVLKAVEAARGHVEESIRRAGSDLDTTTDRRGRPYSLVCTKNQASYDRRAKQRRQDLKDLALLTG